MSAVLWFLSGGTEIIDQVAAAKSGRSMVERAWNCLEARNYIVKIYHLPVDCRPSGSVDVFGCLVMCYICRDHVNKSLLLWMLIDSLKCLNKLYMHYYYYYITNKMWILSVLEMVLCIVLLILSATSDLIQGWGISHGYSGIGGKCERLSISFCRGLRYNLTAMPNFMGHEDQRQAERGVSFGFLKY